MRSFVVFLIVTTLFSCAAKKAHGPVTVVELLSGCPKNGTCTIKLLKNKSLAIRQDEFGSTSYTIEPNAEKDIILFNYIKTVKGNLQDAGYREEIVFEIGGDLNELNLANALQNSNMLFGRFCYCKGQTGYYKVSNGKIALTENPAVRNISVELTISEVPQIVDKFTFSIK